jgi:hypothetical protein
MSDTNAIHYDVWNPAGVDVAEQSSVAGGASDTVDAAGLLSAGVAQPGTSMLFLAISDSGSLAAEDIQAAWAHEAEGGGEPSIDFVELPAFLSQSDPANAGGWFPGPSVVGGSMPAIAYAAGHVSGAAMGPDDSQSGDGPGFWPSSPGDS